MRAMKSGSASSSTRVRLAWGRREETGHGRRREETGASVVPLWCWKRGAVRREARAEARASGVPAVAHLVVALLAAQRPLGSIHHVHDHADDQLVECRVAALACLDAALDPLLILLDPCLGSVRLDVVEPGVEGLVRVRARG